MVAEKWGIDELYLHFVQEFKRTLAVSNCAEALVWSMTKGTILTSKVDRAFFLKNRHEVREYARWAPVWWWAEACVYNCRTYYKDVR